MSDSFRCHHVVKIVAPEYASSLIYLFTHKYSTTYFLQAIKQIEIKSIFCVR